jgi:hypothetical protein
VSDAGLRSEKRVVRSRPARELQTMPSFRRGSLAASILSEKGTE